MRFLTLVCLLGAVLAAVITMRGVCSARNASKHDCVSFAEASKHWALPSASAEPCCTWQRAPTASPSSPSPRTTRRVPSPWSSSRTTLTKWATFSSSKGEWLKSQGTIQDHDGRAEIVLRHTQQLGESAFVVVPPIPADYDVERRGHYSAGKYSHPKAKKSHKKQRAPISIENPGEPQ